MSSMLQRSASTDSSAESLRKRVCKACDRCRLKKSKCDGAHPCTRCKADNAICVFGERKKSHDKVYPKGYVEMLEQQQGQLVSGLQEMYHRLLAGERWNGPHLSEAAGHPLTHDILAALNLLESKDDGSGEMEAFEEDCEKLQARLYRAGAPSVARKGSFSSDSDHSQHSHSISSARNTPRLSTKQAIFKEAFTFSPSPSPVPRSPAPRQRNSYPPPRQSPLHQLSTNNPPAIPNDPQLYQPEWAFPMGLETSVDPLMRSKYASLPTPPEMDPAFPDDLGDLMTGASWMDSADGSMAPSYGAESFNFNNMQDFGGNGPSAHVDPMDLEFNRWIQVQT